MKLTVLVDNNTLIDRNYFGEPGLSYFIEEGDTKILFDLGYSDIFIKNACKMGINLLDIHYLVLSHGHLDHTWGLSYLIQRLEPSVYQHAAKKISIVTHPLTLRPKFDEEEPIGFIHSETVLNKCFHVVLSAAPVWLSKKLVYLGQIERTNSFENKTPLGVTTVDNIEKKDYLLDDSALAYKSSKGIVIITGCSHSGICNIIDYAKKICGDDRVLDVIGGFHLLNPPEEQLDNTLRYFKKLQSNRIHACHCTDLHSKIALSRVVALDEVGVGLTLEFE